MYIYFIFYEKIPFFYSIIYFHLIMRITIFITLEKKCLNKGKYKLNSFNIGIEILRAIRIVLIIN